MLPYPFCLVNTQVHSILGKNYKSLPAYIPLGEGSEYLHFLETLTQPEFQKKVEEILLQKNTNWAISGYLENRAVLLKDCPQMVSEQRFYHLGLDISAPLAAPLFAPLNCEVAQVGYEEGNGNYGGYVVLKCSENGTTFYLLFGHLNPNKLPSLGSKITAGEKFAQLGDFHENGNWFYHTHLQVLTQKGFDEGWINKGYCSACDIATIDEVCPNPTMFLR